MENANHQSKQFMVAEIQLSYKSNVKPSLRAKITGSSDANAILLQSWDLSKLDLIEQFKVLYTNKGNLVLGILELSTGGISATVADPKLIFVTALKAGASGIILSHYAK